MRKSAKELGIKEIFDRETGRYSARLYSDPDIYQLEMEKIFGRSWLFLGHVDQIPKFGDYIVTTMGEDSVIVSRQGDKSILAYLNQCRHRGNRLCLADRGNSKAFVCTYHGWVFDNAGRLSSVPYESRYNGKLDKSEWGAVRVPRVEVYKGLIFGNWWADAPDLVTALGDAAWYLDTYLDATEGGIELIGPQRHRVPCNWKWQAEQHSTDNIHASVSHSSALQLTHTPDMAPPSHDHIFDPCEQGHQFAFPELGHASSGWYLDFNEKDSIATLKFPASPAAEYLVDSVLPEMRERLGETRADQMGGLVMNVFPNLSFNRVAFYLRVWQPRGPNCTEVWNYVFVPKNAPQEVKDAIVNGITFSFVASGILEQDDSENVALCHKGVSEGFMAKQTTLSMTMGLGEGGPHPVYPGTINDVYSEEGGRAFYSHWQDMLMEGEA